MWKRKGKDPEPDPEPLNIVWRPFGMHLGFALALSDLTEQECETVRERLDPQQVPISAGSLALQVRAVVEQVRAERT